MTYDDGEVVPELIVRIGGEADEKGDYVKLRDGGGDCGPPPEGFEAVAEPSSPRKLASLWYWVRLVLLVMCLGLLAGVFAKWVGPYLMDKVKFVTFSCFSVLGFVQLLS